MRWCALTFEAIFVCDNRPRTVSPITRNRIDEKSSADFSFPAGLFSVVLVVVRLYQTPGYYPARCPLVFGLSSYKNLTSDCPTCFPSARREYLNKKCSTNTIKVYGFD